MLRVAHHKLGREISTSGLLSTYEAEHEDGRPVRLRVFLAGLQPAPEIAARFEREAELAGRIEHPGIVPIVAFSASDPVHVSTPVVRGATLAEVCAAAASKRLDPSVAAGIGGDLAEALSAAHAGGLVHAGLSAETIVLGADGRARITDFGLARFITSMSSAYSQVMRGSIESLAPEQLKAPETVGPATDVFGLGLVLYRALTAKEPFEAPSALGMSIRITMGKPVAIDSHGVAIPGSLGPLVMKMLAAEPAERPSMHEVAGALATMTDPGPWREAVRRMAEALAPAAPAPEPSSAPPVLAPPAAPSPPPPAAEAPPPMSFGAPPPGALAASVGAPAPGFAGPAPSVPPFAGPPPASIPDAPVGDEAPELPDVDGRPTLVDSGPLVDEDELPDYLREDQAATELVGGSFGSGYEAETEWPATADVPGPVPKTVVMRDPRAASLAASASWPQPAGTTPAPAPVAPAPRGIPEWALWAAVGAAALALLGGTVGLVILIAS